MSEVDAVAEQYSLSVVVPVFDEEECLAEFHRRLLAVVEELAMPFQVLYVDDGSTDGSALILAGLVANDQRVDVVRLSRNFGHQVAVSAGLEHAKGDGVVVIDADLQDPPEVIRDLVAKWRGGAQVVHAVRSERHGEGRFKKHSASFFYRSIARWADLDLQVDAGDFRLYDRVAVDAVVSMPESFRFIRGMASWVGFRQETVEYVRHSRFAGRSKYPLKKMVRLAIDALTGYSIAPFAATLIGFVVSMLSFAAIPVVILLRALGVSGLGGQTSVIIVVLFMAGVQMLFLGVLGEYVGRLSLETKRRPLYLVQPVGTVIHAAAPEVRNGG